MNISWRRRFSLRDGLSVCEYLFYRHLSLDLVLLAGFGNLSGAISSKPVHYQGSGMLLQAVSVEKISGRGK